MGKILGPPGFIPPSAWQAVWLLATHQPGTVHGWFDGCGHRAIDSLLLLSSVAEPDPHHLLLHGQLLCNHGDLLRAGFGVLQKPKGQVIRRRREQDQESKVGERCSRKQDRTIDGAKALESDLRWNSGFSPHSVASGNFPNLSEPQSYHLWKESNNDYCIGILWRLKEKMCVNRRAWHRVEALLSFLLQDKFWMKKLMSLVGQAESPEPMFCSFLIIWGKLLSAGFFLPTSE